MSKISFESEQDKAVKVLGECLCECRICLATGQCREEDCANCTKGRMIDNCISRLDDFTVLSVNRAANVEYNNYAMYMEGIKRSVRDKALTTVQHGIRSVIGFIGTFSLFLLGVLAVCLVLFNGCASSNMWMYRPPTSVKQELRQREQNDKDMLFWIMNAQRFFLKDVNRDGKIDCIDYAVSFKRMWDHTFQYRGWQNDCIIVQNNNPNNGFNHAFIMVRQTKYPFEWVSIEPQATSIDKIYMKDMWGDRYNPAYDTYDYEKIRYWYDKCIY